MDANLRRCYPAGRAFPRDDAVLYAGV